MKHAFLIIFFFLHFLLFSSTEEQIKTVYATLNPTSISQHLAFYRLYPESLEGKEALKKALHLLSGKTLESGEKAPGLINTDISNIINSLISPNPRKESESISKDAIKQIKSFGNRLYNRALKGYKAKTSDEVLKLPLNQIDLVRSLLISLEEKNNGANLESYEAMIDLMALQILAYLPPNPTPEDKINRINEFIFEEMRFKFPPKSIYSDKIDKYTFLPSVLDGRRGVCLGISILYLAIAQRVDLPLEIVTPPGHIYLRYNGEKTINIETTARGIHLPSEVYLGVNTRKLQTRNVKEVIGLAHFNQASIFWKNGDFQNAINSYKIAKKYMGDDPLLKELLAYQYLFADQKKEGVQILKSIKNYLPDHSVSKNTIAEDYLNGRVDEEGIKSVFLTVDETRESIIKKKKTLEKTLKKYPKFRAALLQLASTHMQLHRFSETLEELKKYHKIDKGEATVEYYLAVLYYMRSNYKNAWKHIENAIKITERRDHNPKVLKELLLALSIKCPK